MSQTTQQPESTETILQLRSVTRRIEIFFESQMTRLHEAMQQLQEKQAEYEVSRRLSADLETQRESWQKDRDHELLRLTQASESLAQSWQELEQTQRDNIIKSKGVRAAAAGKSNRSGPAMQTSNGIRHEKPEENEEGMDLFEMQQLQDQVKRHNHKRR